MRRVRTTKYVLAGWSAALLVVGADVSGLQPLACQSRLTSGESTGDPGDGRYAVASVGPDLIIADLQSVMRFGRVGDITAYASGTNVCNIGDRRVAYSAPTNRHPVFVQGMYRLKDGRFEQIGMGWASHG